MYPSRSTMLESYPHYLTTWEWQAAHTVLTVSQWGIWQHLLGETALQLLAAIITLCLLARQLASAPAACTFWQVNTKPSIDGRCQLINM
jgi:hypothetical protein